VNKVQVAWIVLVFTAGCPPPATMPGASAPPRSDDRASTPVATTSVTYPDVVGKSKDEAEAMLRAAGARDIRTDNDPGSVSFATAKVCSQVPGGGRETSATLPVVLRYCDSTPIAQKPGTQLVGIAVGVAKQRAKAAGFTGRIEVLEITDDPQCKVGTVCRVEPARWELDQDRSMTLYVAKQLTISVPD